jgi:hypothetical protein
MSVEITRATVLQIMPLVDWWINDMSRCPGAALVEIAGTRNGEEFSGRTILPLNSDLSVNFPAWCCDAAYDADVFGDDKDFLLFSTEDAGYEGPTRPGAVSR